MFTHTDLEELLPRQHEKKGMSIIDIKNLLGHAKLDTTQIYLDETEGLTKAAYNKVF